MLGLEVGADETLGKPAHLHLFLCFEKRSKPRTPEASICPMPAAIGRAVRRRHDDKSVKLEKYLAPQPCHVPAVDSHCVVGASQLPEGVRPPCLPRIAWSKRLQDASVAPVGNNLSGRKVVNHLCEVCISISYEFNIIINYCLASWGGSRPPIG
jgi:hypothetical protein